MNTDPIVARIFAEAKRQGKSMKWLAEQSGVAAGTLLAWKPGRRGRPSLPSVGNARAVLNVLGLDLEARSIERNPDA